MGRFLRGAKLDEADVQQLERMINEYDHVTQQVTGWSDGENAKFQKMSAKYGIFDIAPLSMLHLELFGDPVQVISNNTITPVLFDTRHGSPNSLRWDIADQTKILSLNINKKYAFIGSAQWEANATGRRAAVIDAYNQSGVQQWGQTLHSVKPEGTQSDTIPFASGLVGFTFESAYFTVSVYQNSGGDLDLEEFHCTIFEVY
jgi:hypothetical protein